MARRWRWFVCEEGRGTAIRLTRRTRTRFGSRLFESRSGSRLETHCCWEGPLTDWTDWTDWTDSTPPIPSMHCCYSTRLSRCRHRAGSAARPGWQGRGEGGWTTAPA